MVSSNNHALNDSIVTFCKMGGLIIFHTSWHYIVWGLQSKWAVSQTLDLPVSLWLCVPRCLVCYSKTSWTPHIHPLLYPRPTSKIGKIHRSQSGTGSGHLQKIYLEVVELFSGSRAEWRKIFREYSTNLDLVHTGTGPCSQELRLTVGIRYGDLRCHQRTLHHLRRNCHSVLHFYHVGHQYQRQCFLWESDHWELWSRGLGIKVVWLDERTLDCSRQDGREEDQDLLRRRIVRLGWRMSGKK